MPDFRPKPDDVLRLPAPERGMTLDGNGLAPFRVCPASIMPDKPYKITTAKASIYRLTDANDRLWALKVFMREHRPDASAADRLARILNLRGFPKFDACTRVTLPAGLFDVSRYPELEGAILMKWSSGVSLFELLEGAVDGKTPLPRAVLSYARGFLDVMATLEKLGATHTDISSGNVFVQPIESLAQKQAEDERKALPVAAAQLIDLEDLWTLGTAVRTGFTPGYGHPSFEQGQSSARPAGDRYAITILLAELLLIRYPTLAATFTGDGYFRGTRNDPDAVERYNLALPRLEPLCPPLAASLKRAWESRSVEECDPASYLRGLLNDDGIADRMPQFEQKPNRPDFFKWLNVSRDRMARSGPGSRRCPSRDCNRPAYAADKFCGYCGVRLPLM